MEKNIATLSVERELKDELRVIEYDIGNGDIHFHSQIEICIVESGSIEALVNNARRTLFRGDLAVSLAYDSHRYLSNENAKYCVLILPSAVCETFYTAIQSKKLNTPFICNTEYNPAIIDHLTRIKEEHANPLARLGYVYLILGLIKEAVLDNTIAKHDNTELLSNLLLYIADNYNKNLNLTTLSKVFGYHPSYLSAYCKTHIHIGIARYINIIRLKNAVVLMQQRKHTITEITMECGFASTRTFYRAFRHEFGCSPKEYLAQTRTAAN